MRLNGVFKDDMVLQSDRRINVFGSTKTSDASAIICTIENSDGTKLCVSDDVSISEDGSFLISMPALNAGGPYRLTVSSSEENESVTLERIFIGEVWIAGGQSNMEYPLVRSEGSRKTITELGRTNIHFYNVPAFGNMTKDQAEAEDASRWVVIDKDTCGDMSGVAFYFTGGILEALAHADPDVHIGIVGCYLGGTSVSSWQSTKSLMKTPEGRKYIDEFNESIKGITEEDYLAKKKIFDEECEAYNRRLVELLNKAPYISYIDADNILGPGAWPPPSGPLSDRRPGALFEAMVLRIAPLSVKGVIFYQGETDAEGHEADYYVVFKSMIEEWRSVFRNSDLPFVFCELPTFNTSDPKSNEEINMRWAKLREQQRKVEATVPGTYRVVLIDCGEIDNLHPEDKKTPGLRLAQAALKSVYQV